MPSQYTTVDTTYDDRRGGDRVRERRIQDIPDDRISYIRRRERAAFYNAEPERSLVLRKSATQGYDGNDQDDDYFAQRRMTRRDRFADDTDLPPTPDYRQSDPDYRRDDYQQGRSRGRDATPPSDREPSRDNRSRRRHRRARSERPSKDKGSQNEQQVLTRQLPQNKDKLGEEAEEHGQLWYSCKKRNEGSFMEKNFDSSYDGLMAAAAGAAIGAMGVRRMVCCVPGVSEEESKRISKNSRWKTLAGAVAGGVAFNAAENWMRIYTEEKVERREDVMFGVEFAQECVDGLMPKM